jgi:hypothetical protein
MPIIPALAGFISISAKYFCTDSCVIAEKEIDSLCLVLGSAHMDESIEIQNQGYYELSSPTCNRWGLV